MTIGGITTEINFGEGILIFLVCLIVFGTIEESVKHTFKYLRSRREKD